jgi:radical SAM C-methyltransferase
MSFSSKIDVVLVQQGVWDMPLESMPLAASYLKASLLAEADLADEVNCSIANFKGGASTDLMATTLFREGVPDLLAFSVFGWNYRSFTALAETFKQQNPEGLVVFGGTHVANQATRTFASHPYVDIVVNGEGERVFPQIVRSFLRSEGGAPRLISSLRDIPGISFRAADGSVTTTDEAERILNLDSIPSPFLTDAIEMTGPDGEFRYDVCLMETNRGCPYKCSFCYWGGAVGQRVRRFSRERLKAELLYLAKYRVDTIALCDANFGMQPADRDFLEDFIEVRDRLGWPRHLITSWAKNKSKVFYGIVERMKEAGISGSFTLALQTLDDATLIDMRRHNMHINDWGQLAEWLRDRDLEMYGELLWGAPGETVESFLAGYDLLSEHIPSIATYPMVVLPNTAYSENRDDFGLVTVRGDRDDFEYVLAHKSMTLAENERMHRFLFWARILGEYQLFRHIWKPMRALAGISQSFLIWNLADWFDTTEYPDAALVRPQEGLFDFKRLYDAIYRVHTQPRLVGLFHRWWEEQMVNRLPPEHRDFLESCFAYDLLTRPVFVEPGGSSDLDTTELDGTQYYARPVELAYDFPAAFALIAAGSTESPAPRPVTSEILYRVGFCNHAFSSEEVMRYVGFERRTHGERRGTGRRPASSELIVTSSS